MATKYGGPSTQRGINAQNWAAMSLFLQFVKREDFRYIGFEGEKLEDFHLVFDDGKKIVCESKDYKLDLYHIRKVLDKIVKHAQITDQDEILIICREVNKEAKNLIENFKYFKDVIKEKFTSKKHKYKKEHLRLLPQVKFWEVDGDLNVKAVQALVAELLVVWVPDHQLKEITDSLVVRKVYFGSQEGATLSKKDFIQLLEERKKQIAEDSGYYDERERKEKHLKEILKALKNPKLKQWVNNQIAALTDKPDLHFFTLKKLEKQDNVNLQDLDRLWEASIKGTFSIEVFKIFKKNITQDVNRKYFLEFIPKIINSLAGFYRERFLETDIIKVCRSIITKTSKYDREVFEVIKQLLTVSSQEKFYVKRKRDTSWEREELAKLLKDLYENTQGNNFKKEIVKFIKSSYNLVEDDGKFWHYTPLPIFSIARKHVEKDVENGILELKKLATQQYSEFYKRFGRKLEFEGWELMGSSISGWGKDVSISDKHFITKVIKPVLEDYHKRERGKAWQFILKNCITRKESQVSKNKPDFLNRAVIGILVKEHSRAKYKKEAFDILSDFIKMKKGIPWKADLIFQAVRDTKLKDKEKWALVEVSLKAYKNLPVNVFVEQITSDLAAKNHKRAIRVIAAWAKNPEYAKRHTIGSFDIVDNVLKLLDNPKTFNEGAEILKGFVTSDDFIKKDNSWKTWDIAKALAIILEKDFEKGLEILNKLNSPKKPSLNQQTLIASSLYNLAKDGEKKADMIKKAYYEFLKPALDELNNDIKKIEAKFTNRHARESLIQFGEGLALEGLYDEALSLVRIFIKDSDPILENYPDDKEGTFNRHEKVKKGEDDFSIGTVRGWCAWVIQKLVVPRDFSKIDRTRQIIEEVLPLLEELTNDSNYYVRVQACIPLLELVKNRHTILPENRKERFLPMEIAECIENIAFAMLKNKENHKLRAVMKHLAMVFTYMRSLTEKEAMRALEIFLSTEIDEVIEKIDPLFIFFAEFRKNAFKDKNAKILFGEKWAEIRNFNDQKFKKLLIDLLKNGSENVKAHLAWRFWQLPKEPGMDFDKGIKISMRYLPILTQKYSQKVFSNIYYFIKEYVDKKFNECFKLWIKCIKTESKYFKDNWTEDKLHEMYWWPFFYNGKVLVKILENKGVEEFLHWFKKLANYPSKALIANDLDIAAEELIKIKGKKYQEKVKKLLDSLITRNSKYYDFKQEWQQQKS